MNENYEKIAIQWFPGHMTKAQRMIDENMKLVDAVCETGRTAVLFTCTHRVDDAEQEVTVDDLHVSKYYHKGKWYNCHGRPAKEITDLFLQHVAKVGA